MGKLISVWGTPNSGKTAFSLKLAEALYGLDSRKKPMIMVVLTDVVAPALPVVFPNCRSEDMYSVGDLLARTSLTVDDVFSYTVPIQGKSNIGVMGYRENENSHTYPAYTREKVTAFFDILVSHTDYVIVDCMCDPEQSLLSETALVESDRTIWLSTPDLKSMSYTMSQAPHFINRGLIHSRQFRVVNTLTQEPVVSVPRGDGCMGRIICTLPYSAALSRQMAEGSLSEDVHDRTYMQAVRSVITQISKGA